MPPKKKSMTGAGVLSTLKKGLSAAHQYIKTHKLVSKTASALGHKKIAAAADQLGYGKRRRRRRRT